MSAIERESELSPLRAATLDVLGFIRSRLELRTAGGETRMTWFRSAWGLLVAISAAVRNLFRNTTPTLYGLWGFRYLYRAED